MPKKKRTTKSLLPIKPIFAAAIGVVLLFAIEFLVENNVTGEAKFGGKQLLFLPNNSSCNVNEDCQSGYCELKPSGYLCTACTSDSQCHVGSSCANGVCS